jgi:hypothetical protein
MFADAPKNAQTVRWLAEIEDCTGKRFFRCRAGGGDVTSCALAIGSFVEGEKTDADISFGDCCLGSLFDLDRDEIAKYD